MGDFVEEATVTVRPMDEPEKLWPVYGVNNRVGVVLSHHQMGAEFNAPYKHIEQDWFFHNPTRANVGSLGRVPEVPPDALTSPEYQVWRIRQGLLPDFVEILIRLPFFLDLVECHRVGAVKQRLFVENLKEIPIPPLSEAEQQKIVKRWTIQWSRVAEHLGKAQEIEADALSQFLSNLGFAGRDRFAIPKFAIARRSETERWSLAFTHYDRAARDAIEDSNFAVIRLGQIAEVAYGIAKSPTNRPAAHARPYLRVANVQRDSLDLTEVKTINVPDDEFGECRLQNEDLLVCEGNSPDLVGRPAIWRDEIPDCVHQNHLLRVRANRRMVLPEFLLHFMSGYPSRLYFRSRAKFTTNLASINSRDLRELPVSLPPLSKQQALVDLVATARTAIERHRAEADRLKKAIAAETEEFLLRIR